MLHGTNVLVLEQQRPPPPTNVFTSPFAAFSILEKEMMVADYGGSSVSTSPNASVSMSTSSTASRGLQPPGSPTSTQAPQSRYKYLPMLFSTGDGNTALTTMVGSLRGDKSSSMNLPAATNTAVFHEPAGNGNLGTLRILQTSRPCSSKSRAGESAAAPRGRSQVDKFGDYLRWKAVMEVRDSMSYKTEKGATKGKRGKQRYDGIKIEAILQSHKQQREATNRRENSPNQNSPNRNSPNQNSPNPKTGSNNSPSNTTTISKSPEGPPAADASRSEGLPSRASFSVISFQTNASRTSIKPMDTPKESSQISAQTTPGIASELASLTPSKRLTPLDHGLQSSVMLSAVLRGTSVAVKPNAHETSINLIDPAGASVRSLVTPENSTRNSVSGLAILQPVELSAGNTPQVGNLTSESSLNVMSLPTTLGDVYLRICVDQEIAPIRSLMAFLTGHALTMTAAQFAARGGGDSNSDDEVPLGGSPTAGLSSMMKSFHDVSEGATSSVVGQPMMTHPDVAEPWEEKGPPILNADLTTLDLSQYCCGPEGTFAALGVLFHTPNVDTLVLQGCRLNDKTVEFLCLVATQALPRLKVIDVSKNPKLSLGAGKALQRYVSLAEGSDMLEQVIATGTNIRPGCLRSIDGHIKRKMAEKARAKAARRATMLPSRSVSVGSFASAPVTPTYASFKASSLRSKGASSPRAAASPVSGSSPAASVFVPPAAPGPTDPIVQTTLSDMVV